MTVPAKREDHGIDADTMERVLIDGDLSKLSGEQRVLYYNRVCESVGLNPLTKPFAYIRLNNKLQLYALRDATDQLRAIHGVSIEIAVRERIDDLYTVIARARTKDGRTDECLGAVSLKGMSGENLANQLMKCETKARRRVTLSICGLGWLDETEADSIPGARVISEGELPAPTTGLDPRPDPVPDSDEEEARRKAAVSAFFALLSHFDADEAVKTRYGLSLFREKLGREYEALGDVPYADMERLVTWLEKQAMKDESVVAMGLEDAKAEIEAPF